jgi:hypothetical protein
VAHRFAHLFNDPTDYRPWLGDAEVARAYLREVAERGGLDAGGQSSSTALRIDVTSPRHRG